MRLQSLISQNSVVFFTDMYGSRVIVLEARLESRNDMPRLYKLARERLSEIMFLMLQKAA